MRVCTGCLCANAAESVAAAYDVLDWSSSEPPRPDSFNADRMPCLCGSRSSYTGRGLLPAPATPWRNGKPKARASSGY